MEILNFELGSMGVNSFLIIPENSDAVLIDAPENSYATIKNTLQKRGKKLGALLLTHGHFDHIWDAKKFQNDGVKIYAHPDGSKFIEDAGMQNSILGSNELEAVKIDSKLFAGQILKFGDAEIEVKETPGHCPGSVIFYIPNAKSAYVGDVLFAGSIGRTDLWGGSFPVLEKSIKTQIYTLPNDTKIFSGHGPSSSVAEEKSSNAYVRA